jgi:hypothetical protein
MKPIMTGGKMKKRKTCLCIAVLCLLPQAVMAEVAWQRHEIGSQRNPIYLCVQDMDGDGDLDIVLAGMGIHTILWYENLLH